MLLGLYNWHNSLHVMEILFTYTQTGVCIVLSVKIFLVCFKWEDGDNDSVTVTAMGLQHLTAVF